MENVSLQLVELAALFIMDVRNFEYMHFNYDFILDYDLCYTTSYLIIKFEIIIVIIFYIGVDLKIWYD